MSKRNFADVDCLIPSDVWALYPEQERELGKIQKIESEICHLFTHRQRSSVVNNSDVSPVQRLCRVYVSHEFVSASQAVDPVSRKMEKVKGYCLITVEGMILDPEYNKHISFGSLWEANGQIQWT